MDDESYEVESYNDDSYTEVTSQGWLSRIGDSIKGILFGLVLFIIAFPLLWWNEGRSVERYNSLKEGQGLVIGVAAEPVDSANQGKLVHVQGLAETDEILSDDVFGVSENAIKLNRDVSMFQWQEDVETHTKEEVGGKQTTTKTYTYSKNWSNQPIDSSRFKKSGHDNPAMIYKSKTLRAKVVNMGGFRLNPSQITRISGKKVLSLDGISPPVEISGKKTTIIGNGLYLGDNPSDPKIGDLEIKFTTVGSTDISLVAQQQGDSFKPYQTKAGGKIDLLEPGLTDADAMFAAAHTDNTIITWGIRIGGFLMMWWGLSLIFKPLVVFASVLPFLGNLTAMGIGVFTFLMALPFTLVTIAIAWIAYRPILAGCLIAIAIIALVAMKFVPRRQLVSAGAGAERG